MTSMSHACCLREATCRYSVKSSCSVLASTAFRTDFQTLINISGDGYEAGLPRARAALVRT